MERLRVIRIEETDQGALGVLTLDGKFFCFTLEPDSKDLDRPQIPDGTYKLRAFTGYRWKSTLEIVVPGHTAVLFHVGNTEEDSQMCVLLGSSPGHLAKKGKRVRAVFNSRKTYKRFQKEIVSSPRTAGDEITFVTATNKKGGSNDEEI